MENSVLTFVEYKIDGNEFRAYYDADGKLVFVLDNTISDRKPNALLVINPVGDRKWDDILSNDYGVDLETVRPKKDNKYQKLDIEYSGLSEYDNLITAYKHNGDVSSALVALAECREDSVRRAASERLAVAEETAEKSRETIIRTKESIDELQNKLRQLRSKLSQQKKQVGREPTKKSASKILRTDAQIDATNEKLRRAKKRLDNAQRRLVAADEDAELAREILSQDRMSQHRSITTPRPTAVIQSDSEKNLNVAAVNSVSADVVRQSTAVNDDIEDEETISFVEAAEPKAEIMADKNEEVKPLFDSDPEILDEEIAFKPIEFGVSSPAASEPVSENPDVYESVVEDKPLSFTPPTESAKPIDVKPVTEVTEDNQPTTDTVNTTPVLDTIKSVDLPSESFGDSGTAKSAAEQQHLSEAVAQNTKIERPVPPAATLSASTANAAARPVSPITGNAAPTNPAPRKPTLIYYVMLILLILLSIFTLWLYQKNTSDKTPDLTATVATTDDVIPEPADENVVSPFIPEEKAVVPEPVETIKSAETVAAAPTSESKPVVDEPVSMPTPVVEPEPVVAQEQVVPAAVEQVQISVPAPTNVADVVIETIAPAPVPVEEPTSVVPTEEEILASKPSYNVSQNDKMFVAAPEYDTETIINTSAASVDLPMCPDGTAPDINGCCPGEIFTDMGEMGFNCCPETGGDCFPPLI